MGCRDATGHEEKKELKVLYRDLENPRPGQTRRELNRRIDAIYRERIRRYGREANPWICPFCDGPKERDDFSCRWESCEKEARELEASWARNREN